MVRRSQMHKRSASPESMTQNFKRMRIVPIEKSSVDTVMGEQPQPPSEALVPYIGPLLETQVPRLIIPKDLLLRYKKIEQEERMSSQLVVYTPPTSYVYPDDPMDLS